MSFSENFPDDSSSQIRRILTFSLAFVLGISALLQGCGKQIWGIAASTSKPNISDAAIVDIRSSISSAIPEPVKINDKLELENSPAEDSKRIMFHNGKYWVPLTQKKTPEEELHR